MNALTVRPRGFTLVELLIAVALAGLLALFAWPSMQAQLIKGRRADATAALHKLLLAQERHLALHGLYAQDMSALGLSAPGHPGWSPEGLYRIELQGAGADAYLAVARARDDGPQAGDGPCTQITLRVTKGFTQPGPSAACWNR